jgi:hypothetical protein
MIERIDELLWQWGEWAGSYSPAHRCSGLTTRYKERGVMSTNAGGDNPQAEMIDRIVAGFPPYLSQARKVVMRRYLWHWRIEDIGRDIGVGRQKVNTLMDRAHVWIDAKLELPREKTIDRRAHMI